MAPSLIKLPYEVKSNIVERITIADVTNLARTCKELQYLEHEENICRKFLAEKLPHSPEVAAAIGVGHGFSATFRRIAKRHESIATASPYSICVLGFCDSYLYCQGVVCYTLDDRLRILDLHKSHGCETVIYIPKLLCAFLPETEADSGRLRILHYNKGIISCIYRIPTSDSVSYLIVFDLKGQIILTERLEATEKIFVRHNAEVLYYGLFTGNINDQHNKWVLRGYQLKQQKWYDNKIYLPELIGSDIGATVCFEIIGDYFYALSNQTTSDVEEVDWTSFYHCARFPARFPCKELIEKTLEDEHMWRRQHSEGPIDDRWASLSLHLNEVSGDVNIIETRSEFTSGASISQRTCYTTKVVFPERLYAENCQQSSSSSSSFSSSSCSSSLSSAQSAPSLPFGSTSASLSLAAKSLQSSPVSPGTRRRPGKNELAVITNDRLALTLTASDNPHWHPPQIRLPRNVHPNIDGPFALCQTPLHYYNASTGAFVDLIDDRTSDRPDQQRLRLRVGSRLLAPPIRDESGFIIPEQRHPLTNDPMPGYNEKYISRDVALWPPDQSVEGPSTDALEDWYNLINPPSHLGNVEGTADSSSILFTTGGSQKGQPNAMVFINFDPTLNLPGLNQWGQDAKVSCFPLEKRSTYGGVDVDLRSSSGNGASSWIQNNVPAMFSVIKRGYVFGRSKQSDSLVLPNIF